MAGIKLNDKTKIKSLVELYELIPDDQRVMVDVLRQIVIENLPKRCKEKISFNVPFISMATRAFVLYGPLPSPRGGIKKGVLFGLWQGNKLADTDHYLTHGTNKKVFYKIFHSVDDIDIGAIVKLLKEAVKLDGVCAGPVEKLRQNFTKVLNCRHIPSTMNFSTGRTVALCRKLPLKCRVCQP